MGFFSELDFGDWLYGLFAAVVSGGANAVVGGVALNLVDPRHFNTLNPDFYKLVVTLFLANGTMAFFLYLKQNPVPKIVHKEVTTTTTTVEKTETSKPKE